MPNCVAAAYYSTSFTSSPSPPVRPPMLATRRFVILRLKMSIVPVRIVIYRASLGVGHGIPEKGVV